MVAQESREQDMRIVGHIFRMPSQTEAQTSMLYITNQSKRLFTRQLQLKCKLELVMAIESILAENKKFGIY